MREALSGHLRMWIDPWAWFTRSCLCEWCRKDETRENFDLV